jgi:hypothetical protein
MTSFNTLISLVYIPIELQDCILDFYIESSKESLLMYVLQSLQDKHKSIFLKNIKIDNIWNSYYIPNDMSLDYLLTKILNNVEDDIAFNYVNILKKNDGYEYTNEFYNEFVFPLWNEYEYAFTTSIKYYSNFNKLILS